MHHGSVAERADGLTASISESEPGRLEYEAIISILKRDTAELPCKLDDSNTVFRGSPFIKRSLSMNFRT